MDTINTNTDFLTNFRNKTKNIKTVKHNFTEFMNADVVTLDATMKELLKDDSHQGLILKNMCEVDIETVNTTWIGRIQLLLNYISYDNMKKYSDYYTANISLKTEPEKVERPVMEKLEITKDIIKEYNLKLVAYNKELEAVILFNSKAKSITDTLEGLIEDDLYGDVTLDEKGLRHVYFKMYGLDKSFNRSFIKDVRKSNADGLHLIKKVTVDDISGLVPDSIDSAYEIKFFFEDGADAELMEKCKILFEAYYEKYCQMSDIMKQGSADWGFDVNKKDNMSNFNAKQKFSGTNNMNSTTLDEDTDEDVELEELVDEDELEDDGFNYLKKQLNKAEETDYYTAYHSNSGFSGTDSVERVDKSEIEDYEYETVDYNSGYKIINFCSGLQYIYIIHKPFKGYMDDGYKAIEFIEFEDGTCFHLGYVTLAEPQDAMLHMMTTQELNNMKIGAPYETDFYNDCMDSKRVEKYVNHIVM